MKKISISILALAALLSCSKASLDEATPQASAPKGETICVNIPSPTKSISLSDYQYAFQGTESLVVVSSEGKIATLTNTAESPYSFSGAFDGALGAESDNFTVYYNCYSASSKALSFTQNGQPWLTASLPEQTRDEDGRYSLSPVLEAVEGVRTIAIVSDFAGTVSFHAKTANISSFAGGSFSGSKDVNDIALTADNNGKYTAFVNIPSGMTGGYWLKVTKEGESGAMYKSYSTSETISSNTQVTLTEFTPAEVLATIDLSGLKSSYNYYVSGDVTSANATANDVVIGSVPYTISGISSKLPYEVTLTVSADGSSAPSVSQSASSTGLSGTFSDVKLSGLEWGARTVSATLSLKVGGETVATASASETRYITGLPYNAAKSSASNFSGDWSTSGGKSVWDNGYLRYGSNCIVSFRGYYVPSGVTIKSTILYKIVSYTSTRLNNNTTTLTVGDNNIFSETVKGTATTKTYESSADVSFSISTKISTTATGTSTTWASSHSQLHYFGAIYR